MTGSKDTKAGRLAALKLLARRALTTRELVKKLILKGIPFEEAKATAIELERQGYIDDRAIIEDFIRRGRETRLVGRFMLRFELQQRGVDQNLVEEQLEKLYPEKDEIAIAREFASRKLKSMSGLPVEKRLRRLGGALQRRGFSHEHIARVMLELELVEVKD